MAEVILKNVRKVYDKDVVAVDDANIEIRDKEFVVLVGPSGCGKSTTLRMIAGLEEISGGEIYIDGTLVNDIPPKDRDIAMVFQNYALYPHMTVYQNMAFGLKLRKYPKDEIDARVQEAADILGIQDLLERKPKALSGGQRQRVAVGRAIVRKPKVFLFDEPLSNLDAKLRVQMRAEISKLHTKLEATMIYVTHDQTEAMTMGDRIVVMKDGRIQQIDAPLSLYNDPVNQFVAGFIGSPAMNFFSGKVNKVSSTGIHFILENSDTLLFKKCQKPEVSVGENIQFGVRPEHFIFMKNQTQTINGKVYAVERLGGETYIYLNSKTDNDIIVHCSGDREIKVGENLDVGFSIKDCHLFNSNGWAIDK